ncbi:MAG: hypothetical protein BMS9Abin11_1159 [Gammaproteobacteria bacterium]|nr:MAG: hypothetical protein BMS9Abin11_1159 [Gammaproteobacteria bacterium]
MLIKRVVSIIFLVAIAVGDSSAMARDLISVYVKNHCRENISVAYSYKSTDGVWIKRGWMIVRRGQRKRTNVNTYNRIFYFYATSPSGRKWNGVGKSGSLWTIISSDKFKVRRGEKLYGSNKRRVKFIRQRVELGTKSFTGHFRCN